MDDPVGIRALTYRLGSSEATLEDLEAEGLLVSPADLLRSFGFDRVRIAESDEERRSLARVAAQNLLEDHDVDPLDIDVLILFGGLPPEPAPPGEDGELIGRFRYPVGRLQHELGLNRAVAFAIGQQGCAALISALRVARSLLIAEEARNVLCVGVDVVPPGAAREVVYNVLSDGACAALVSRPWERLRPVAFRQVTKGYYWDSPARRDEIVAAYFPTARNVIREAVGAAGLTLDDLSLVVPDNVSARSWEILLDLLDVPEERAFLGNAARKGHSISADLVVNLKDAMEDRAPEPGAPVALFTFGFGANWGAAVLRA
ncbi:MAG TPA: 3-oxoacyl-[acyl-carrier-protein] synthase III C-terminal domain-containing protein [Actinomycetota bacterium]|jgi:3-oxoacyl-[acyl-carrier-protein] synthase-3|nr:3-oxoacyl-[acyl-carrier-protein] synthase III C-terminal domain-containing protein [Actinomycetota bacterium]